MSGARRQPSQGIASPLPHSLDAERAVLGAILVRNAALSESLDIGVGDFFLRSHQVIFRAISELIAEGTPADLVTVVSALEEKGRLEEAGGAGYVSGLVDGVPVVTNAVHYARIVKKLADRRGVIHAAEAVLTEAQTPEEIDMGFLANLRQRLDLLAGNGTHNGNGHAPRGTSLSQFLKKTFPEPEYLVSGLISRGSTSMIYAKPHHLKSYLALGLALAATAPCKALGQLDVARPVKTLLVQIEDPPGQVKQTIQRLLLADQFEHTNWDNLWILTRDEIDVRGTDLFSGLAADIRAFGPDWIILDVLRRLFPAGASINDPKDAPVFLEEVDRLRALCDSHVTLVHHAKGASDGGDIFDSALGSKYLASWAKSIARLTNKRQQPGRSRVDVEFDNGVGVSLDPMRLILEPNASFPLLLVAAEDDSEIAELRFKLGDEWTLHDLAEAADASKTTVWRLVRKWVETGLAEKVQKAKSGRGGGMARFRFVTPIE